jgi:hypothetical protein
MKNMMLSLMVAVLAAMSAACGGGSVNGPDPIPTPTPTPATSFIEFVGTTPAQGTTITVGVPEMRVSARYQWTGTYQYDVMLYCFLSVDGVTRLSGGSGTRLNSTTGTAMCQPSLDSSDYSRGVRQTTHIIAQIELRDATPGNRGTVIVPPVALPWTWNWTR